MKNTILLSLLCATLFFGNNAMAGHENNCHVEAFTNSHFSKPKYPKIAVRTQPSFKAKVIDTIMPHFEYGDPKGTYVTISDIQNGFARVYYSNESARNINKVGWIETKFLAFSVYNEVGFARPDNTSKPITHMEIESIGSDNIKSINACNGEWLNITAKPPKQKMQTMWVRGICANQETSCDGLKYDKYELR